MKAIHNPPSAQTRHHTVVFYLAKIVITTELGETVVLQIAASSREEAEMAAINMVEMGQADVEGTCVVEGFARHA